MKAKWAFLTLVFTIFTVLTGCEPLLVLDPKGPQAETTSNVIWISIISMSFIVITVLVLLVIILSKYRASKQPADYEPPHIEGHPVVEGTIIGIPILIVIFLSVVSVISSYQVESTPAGYEDEEPLVIYASSSNWKWHFSYPEQDIETVNYVFFPANRSIQFKLYSYGPITSFWIPQLAGQKYAMGDMVTKINLAADAPGEFMGRNANFSGEGFAENTFNATALSQEDFDKWVEDIKKTEDPITEEKFNELLQPGHLGQLSFTGTHLDFSPAPEGEHAGHQHGDSSDKNHSEHEQNNKDKSSK
ncbi:cytochrome aa3 quinol oxidase subunit II [Ornithinibacillus gellani]|uniref:cytochrome aa3 quinol oxidase subunit II n=1 Tax=Ornithinibacillus gellani TaxID=2293253 RepID=UPI000F46B2AE|nr:cytochrome aa3 quinol oxidase subunit II [Ornithinibacillus gellani]TQS76262.1 cytochrome aa3 quinol oxidase subunit II [Ornithinibacillus gellani]